MSEVGDESFSNIIREIVKKSLFSERQIEILLHSRNLKKFEFSMSRGSYYRQRGQVQDKLAKLYYTVALLEGFGVLSSDVISSLSKQVSVIKDSDVFPEREADIITVIDDIIKQACKL